MSGVCRIVSGLSGLYFQEAYIILLTPCFCFDLHDFFQFDVSLLYNDICVVDSLCLCYSTFNHTLHFFDVTFWL